MTTQQQIINDFESCVGEMRVAETIRTVASLNQWASKKEFVAAAVAAGQNASTAAIQFVKSRELDAECDNFYDPEWRNLDPNA